LKAIRSEMLSEQQLVEFVKRYHYKNCSDKSVALIMAGNIPFVGFADVLYSILCGVKIYVKYSSKDSYTMRWLINLLNTCTSSIKIEEYVGQKVDMIIATGSNNSNRYFEYNFSGKPSIMRGSRTSMAVVSGKESEQELLALWNDVFLRYGQGCRNVSLIFVPREYSISILTDAWKQKMIENKHYINAYHQQKALMTMRSEEFYDLGYSALVEQKSLHVPLSLINIARYDSMSETDEFIAENIYNIQCVMKAENFGKAQFPSLYDYADNIDVMKFLLQ
ncbi:MAG: acyl-CoA reductase, partial [Rikenellaceae bacterium]